MHFSVLILRSLWRRPVRSVLTAVAMAIAVAAVVALVGIAYGFESSFTSSYRAAGIDLVVLRAGQQERINSTLDESLGEKLAAIRGVRGVTPALMDVVSFEDKGLMAVAVRGTPPDARLLQGFKVVAGRRLEAADTRAIFMGDILARNLGLTAGDKLELYGHDYTIVGVFHAASSVDNGAIVVPLAEQQRELDRAGQVTGFTVNVDEPDDPRQIDRIMAQAESLAPALSAMSTQDHIASIMQIRMARGMAWVTSLIGLVVGAIGVLNTMFMSVYERTREIGVLRAIGWRRRRVVLMIVGESVLLSLAGAAAGSLAAVVLTKALASLPAANGMIEGSIAWRAIAQGFALAVVVALVGAAYPAYRSTRLTPCDAMREG